MIVFHILIIIISLIVAIMLSFECLFEDDDKCVYAMLISFLVCIGSFVFFIVGSTKCEKSEWIYSEEPYAVESIVSLNDNNMTNGKFYLRSGYINEDLYYQYIVQLRNGGFKANKVKSEDSTLYYDTENYRVEWHKKTKKWLYWEQEEIYHKIYIPEGSITVDYSIDLN